MEIKTADNRFNFTFWWVLNKIRDLMLPDKKVISYHFNLDITRKNPISFGEEERVIKFLISNKVIKEVKEPDHFEFGEEGTEDYKVSKIYHFKIMRKFYFLYDKYSLKLLPQKDIRFKKLKSKMLKELIVSKFSGEYETKLLQILSNGSKTASEIKDETGVGKEYHLISNVNKKLKNTAFKIEPTKSGTFKEYKKYRLIIS